MTEPYDTPDERVWGDYPTPMGTPELNERITLLRADREDYADAMLQVRFRGIVRWIRDKWNAPWTR